MMNWKVVPLLLVITGCQDIFTTNHLTALKQDPSSLSSEALLAAAESGDSEAIEVLEEKRITLEEVQNNSDLKKQFTEETKLLADVKIEEADFTGAINDIANADEEEGGAGAVLESILEDEERLEDFEAGADYIVELYKVNPDEVTDTQKLAGSVGVMSDVITSDEKSEKLQEELEELKESSETGEVDFADINTEELDPEVFTKEDIENIELAQDLMKDVDVADEFGFDFADMLGGGAGES